MREYGIWAMPVDKGNTDDMSKKCIELFYH